MRIGMLTLSPYNKHRTTDKTPCFGGRKQCIIKSLTKEQKVLFDRNIKLVGFIMSRNFYLNKNLLDEGIMKKMKGFVAVIMTSIAGNQKCNMIK